MIIFDGPVSPDALTTFVRKVPTSPGFILSELLPDRYLSTNEVDFAELTKTNRTARFRTYDGRLHVSDRNVGTKSKVKLPPLSTSYNMGEYERLQLEFSRTQGTNDVLLINAIYDDAVNGTEEVLNRMELARGDALTDFKFTMLGPDADEPAGLEADFGAPAGHLVTAAVPWSTTATALALSELIAWHDQWVADNNNSSAGAIWTSTKVARFMQRNAEFINAKAGAAAGRTRLTRTELNDVLDSENLPPIRIQEGKVDVDGATVPLIPDDRLLFVPSLPGALGYTAWGVSATALELVGSRESDLSFEDAPGIVGVVEKTGPPYRQFTYVDAVGMPVITNPKALLVADVL